MGKRILRKRLQIVGAFAVFTMLPVSVVNSYVGLALFALGMTSILITVACH